MKLINNFATKSSLTGRWVGISAENWRISGEIVTKNIKCCRQTGNRGGHFVFWDIEPEMLGHNPAEVPGHRPVILLLLLAEHNFVAWEKNKPLRTQVFCKYRHCIQQQQQQNMHIIYYLGNAAKCKYLKVKDFYYFLIKNRQPL